MPKPCGPYNIRNSNGVNEYYRYYRKHRPKGHEWYLTEHQFFSLFRKVNAKIVQAVLKGEKISFPYEMGNIMLHCEEYQSRIVNGKLVTNRPVDLNKTFELWAEDKEAYKNKVYVRTDYPLRMSIVYAKPSVRNGTFYSLSKNKFFKQKLKEIRKNPEHVSKYFITDNINIHGLYD